MASVKARAIPLCWILRNAGDHLVASIKWTINNTLGIEAGTVSVDEDQMLKCPRMVDQSESKRAGDMVVGDCFHLGNSRSVTYVIATIEP
jgi:hypothetical protein